MEQYINEKEQLETKVKALEAELKTGNKLYSQLSDKRMQLEAENERLKRALEKNFL